MTGGTVVVLGEVGRNFGAGMTDGLAFVFDECERLPERHNPESVALRRLSDPSLAVDLRALIERHVELTGSARGRWILDNWSWTREQFWVVQPKATEQPLVAAATASTVERRRVATERIPASPPSAD
jgi:glutamate synthase domain-containing protein 3